MIHYKDIEDDLEQLDSPTGKKADVIEMCTLRVLHCIAGDLDSIAFALRCIAEVKQRGAKPRKRSAPES
jgi:hypothetical protein